MLKIIAISVGASVGAVARYAVGLRAVAQFGPAFPYGTMIINIVGSLLIGVLMTLFTTRLIVSEPVRLLFITGLLGGFTTFSAFSLELFGLIELGNYTSAVLYLFGSVGGGLVATIIGVALVRVLAA